MKNQVSVEKIVVTGGAGFIGSAVVRYIINQTPHTVINVDKLTYAGNLDSLKSVSNSTRYNFERVDICDYNKLEEVFRKYKPTKVMHLAAESHVDRSIEGPADFINTNIIGTFNLLEVSRRYLSSEPQIGFKFHHISTDEVYGDLPHPDECEGELPLFTENTSYKPSSPYSASKASSDHLVRAWARTYGLPTLVTNCSNNYGPFHYPEKLIPLIILNAIHGKSLPVYGDGSQIRDWLYVEDHARALYKIVMEGKIGETYNIGGFNEKRNIDVVKTICSILDSIYPVVSNSNISSEIKSYFDLVTPVADRPGHDRRYAIDSTKIKNELGWEPLESFESGIEKTISWYLQNKDWWSKLYSGNKG